MGADDFAVLIVFRSTIADSGEWDGSKLLAPAGKPHAVILREALRETVTDISEAWNEEDYAWQFICRAGSVTVSVLVSSVEDGNVLVIVSPVVFVSWFRRQKISGAVSLVADRITAVLSRHPRVSDVRRYTSQEYQAAGRGGGA